MSATRLQSTTFQNRWNSLFPHSLLPDSNAILLKVTPTESNLSFLDEFFALYLDVHLNMARNNPNVSFKSDLVKMEKITQNINIPQAVRLDKRIMEALLLNEDCYQELILKLYQTRFVLLLTDSKFSITDEDNFITIETDTYNKHFYHGLAHLCQTSHLSTSNVIKLEKESQTLKDIILDNTFFPILLEEKTTCDHLRDLDARLDYLLGEFTSKNCFYQNYIKIKATIDPSNIVLFNYLLELCQGNQFKKCKLNEKIDLKLNLKDLKAIFENETIFEYLIELKKAGKTLKTTTPIVTNSIKANSLFRYKPILPIEQNKEPNKDAYRKASNINF